MVAGFVTAAPLLWLPSFFFPGIPAFFGKLGGFGPAFRLPGYDRILPVLLGVQPHRSPGRPAEKALG